MKGITMNDFSTIITDVFEHRAEAQLSLAEERATIASAQLGDEQAKLRLVLAYAPALRNGVASYVRTLADSPQPSDLDDLRQEAVLGLLEAIASFDPLKHDRLAATAPSYVRNNVATAAWSSVGFTVPARTLTRFFGILRAADGNVYDAAKLAPEYEMKTETFLSVLSAVRNVDSYDEIIAGDFGSTDNLAASPIWDNSAPDADDVILVEAAFSAVDTLEKDVIRLAYGFSDFDTVPDAEIGARLGFSRPKVQRTRATGLGKMRVALGVA